jgi:hypothetical protein
VPKFGAPRPNLVSNSWLALPAVAPSMSRWPRGRSKERPAGARRGRIRPRRAVTAYRTRPRRASAAHQRRGRCSRSIAHYVAAGHLLGAPAARVWMRRSLTPPAASAAVRLVPRANDRDLLGLGRRARRAPRQCLSGSLRNGARLADPCAGLANLRSE